MSFDIKAGVSNTPKEHAIRKPQINNNNPAAEQEVATKEIRSESGKQWEKVESKGKKEAEIRLALDTVEIGSTTVYAPETVKAASAAPGLSKRFDQLKHKFIDLFESTYANCFHHNRLIAKVAEWSVGNIMERLAMVGMSPQELTEIKDNVRENLITQNEVSLAQVMYDETQVEVIG